VTALSRAVAVRSCAAAAIAALSLAGCGTHSPQPAAQSGGCTVSRAPLALAVGARANSPNPLLSQVSPLIIGATEAGRPITLIRIDGSPKVAFDQPFRTNAQNSQTRQSDLKTYLGEIQRVFQGPIHAKAPGADVLTALTLAAQATHPGGDVVVIDSGLQTVSPLDFQHNNLLEATPGDVVSFLRHQNLLPDLRGRHVTLVGFGETAAPQHRLDLYQQRNVIAIWQQVAKAAGAACVAVNTQPNTSAALTGVPAVPLVAVPLPPVIRPCGTTVLNASNHVNFIANRPIFIDPAGARATLQLLAGKIRNGNQTVQLIGSTATWGPVASRFTLSRQRANAVKQMLVSLGISADRIQVQGDGSTMPGRVTDTGPNGALLPGPAAEDREVVAKLTCHG
jgi:outer membrane protein OmpA-like peptidoglycan-associated protein